MTFASPHMLWALLALPLLALIELRAVRRSERALLLLVGGRTPHPLLAQQRPRARRTGSALRLLALASLVLGAAGPQWGRETVRRTSSGSDLVFVLDVSASMTVRDVPPSRLDEARREALALLERVEGSRVGVVAFAGDAVRLCPLTLDHAATRLTLEAAGPGSVSTPGTDLGRSLRAALQLLPAGRREDQAIVLWTDGEDLEGRARDAVRALRDAGVRVFAVGVGTPSGDVIPVVDDQDQAVDVKRDESGQVVRSRLDEALLRDLGRSTRGGYFAASHAGGELPGLLAAMGSLAHTQHGARAVERPIARFPACALAAFALLAAELTRERRRVARRARGPAGAARTARAAHTAAVLALPLAGALAAALADPARAETDWARGDRAFRAGRWARAESLYAARARTGAPPALRLDLATARAAAGDVVRAMRELGHLTDQPDRVGATASYNLGTLEAGQRDYDRALGELRRALEANPGDADARWNYELVARMRDRARPKTPPPPQPKPRGNAGQSPPQQGGSSGAGTPPPQPGGGAQQQPGTPPRGIPPQPGAGGAPGMTRDQAEQLLGSLDQLERLEKQHARRVSARQERKGKDW